MRDDASYDAACGAAYGAPACQGKAAYTSRDIANKAIKHTMASGKGRRSGARLHVYECRHVDCVVYHVGSTLNRMRHRDKYRD